MNKALIIGGSIIVGSLLGVAIGTGINQIRRKASEVKSVKQLVSEMGIPETDAKKIVKDIYKILKIMKGASDAEKEKAINTYYKAALKTLKKAA
jgi:polyhydroxyalkanoate synthesis regulator phasin